MLYNTIKPCCRQYRSQQRMQQGAALLLALFLAVILVLVLFFRPSDKIDHAREQKTQDALAQAKAALIAWSVLQGDLGKGITPRPGSLPCPDRNSPSSINAGTASGSCSASGGTTIGRLPWKTLGIDDLRDADGESLWYVVSDNFRKATSGSFPPINSDTRGNLLLYAVDGFTLLTPTGEELAAVVFSAGAALAGQDRSADPNTPASYLESANTRNNAIASGPFISGPIKNAQGDIVLNDRTLGISARELITAVEKRVLNEVQTALATYANLNGGKYPNPAKPNGANCATTITKIGSPTTCASDITVCFGRFPEDIPVHLLPLPTWFQQNGWGRVLAYMVNKNNVLDPSAAECSTTLNIDGSTKNYGYVIFAPGSPKSGQTRPSTSLVDYLENTENTDAWTSLSSGQSRFVTPNTSSNDQLRSLPP